MDFQFNGVQQFASVKLKRCFHALNNRIFVRTKTNGKISFFFHFSSFFSSSYSLLSLVFSFLCELTSACFRQCEVDHTCTHRRIENNVLKPKKFLKQEIKFILKSWQFITIKLFNYTIGNRP